MSAQNLDDKLGDGDLCADKIGIRLLTFTPHQQYLMMMIAVFSKSSNIIRSLLEVRVRFNN